MLKDEVALSKEKMKKIDIEPIIQSVVDDYNNIYNIKRNIQISFVNDKNKNYFINGIENRIEQIIANLLDNSISFSQDNQKIFLKIKRKKLPFKLLMKVKDLKKKI
jgi:two-component system sensor histidine kinase ChvG